MNWILDHVFFRHWQKESTDFSKAAGARMMAFLGPGYSRNIRRSPTIQMSTEFILRYLSNLFHGIRCYLQIFQHLGTQTTCEERGLGAAGVQGNGGE